MATVTRPISRVEVISQGLNLSVQVLIRNLRTNSGDELRWDFIRESLEALPLPTSSYALAMHRLDNARNYRDRGEFGAAGFELRQLMRAIKLD